MAYVIGDDCIACGTCIDECPVGAISEGEKYSINPDMCTECAHVLMFVLLRLSAFHNNDFIKKRAVPDRLSTCAHCICLHCLIMIIFCGCAFARSLFLFSTLCLLLFCILS